MEATAVCVDDVIARRRGCEVAHGGVQRHVHYSPRFGSQRLNIGDLSPPTQQLDPPCTVMFFPQIHYHFPFGPFRT
ncbi:unnamed protein product [Calypogeia fissa]